MFSCKCRNCNAGSITFIFLGLIKLVEQTVRMKHASSPNKPIYLLGDSFGGCLALAVAARNPKIDLVVILANPGLNELLVLVIIVQTKSYYVLMFSTIIFSNFIWQVTAATFVSFPRSFAW